MLRSARARSPPVRDAARGQLDRRPRKRRDHRAAGVGTRWLACAIGAQACRDNRSVPSTRLARLIADLSLAEADGRIAARMKSLARVDLLILDDWGREPLEGNARHHLLEILEDRYGRGSTLVPGVLPVAASYLRRWRICRRDTAQRARRHRQWTVEITKRSDTATGFQVLPRRWVVERILAWLARCRRLTKDWEKSVESSPAWALIASIRMLTPRTAQHCDVFASGSYAWRSNHEEATSPR